MATTRLTTLQDRADRANCVLHLRRLASQLDNLSPSELAKWYNPAEERDDKGRWTGHGGRLAQAMGRAKGYLQTTNGRKALLAAGATAAATAGLEVGEHSAVHELVDFVGSNIGLHGALAMSALTVGVRGVAKKLGIDVHKAQHALAHLAREAARHITGPSSPRDYGMPEHDQSETPAMPGAIA